MKGQGQNMEDFLREKEASYSTPYSADWADFEPKLRQAFLLRRLKVAVLFLLMASIMTFGLTGGKELLSASLHQHEHYYQAREKVSAPALVTSQSPAQKAIVGNVEERKPKVMLKAASAAKPKSPSAQSNPSAVKQLAASPTNNQQPLAAPREKELHAAEQLMPQVELLQQNELEDLMQLEQKTLAGPGITSEPRLATALWEWRHKEESESGPYISPLQRENPWSYSVNIYPNFTFRKFIVDPGKEKYLHRDFIDVMQVSESGGVSLNMGLRLSRRIGKITYLNSGLEYISYKTESEVDFVKFRTAMLDETGAITGYQLNSETQRVILNDVNRYHYFNIPLSISHEPWATDHIRLNLEAGFSFMYFASAEGRSLDYATLDVIDLNERSYRNHIASAFMKVGAVYHLSPRFNFGFEPTLMYFTNTIYTEEYPFQVIPYSVGMNLKLQMKLN